MKERIVLTDKEKTVVQELNDSLYTVDYLEKWINRDDNVFVNALAALSAVEAKGYYRAIQLIARKKEKE